MSLYYDPNNLTLRLKTPDGKLLIAAVDGYMPVDEDFFAPFRIAVEPGGCAPVAGDCFAENFLGELIVSSPGEVVEKIHPFEAEDIDNYTIVTGALVLSNYDSFYECDGPGDDRAQLLLVTAD